MSNLKSAIKATDEKVCTVTDWGTETNNDPRKITRTVFKTDTAGFYEIYTGRSSHSGLYSHEAKSEIVTVDNLKLRYENQLSGMDL